MEVEMDWGTLAVAGLMAVSNMGGLAWMGKHYVTRVEKHDEEIPEMLGTIKALKDSAESTSKCMDELYKSRNEHAESIVQLNERLRAQRELCEDRYTSSNHPRRRATDK
jgi:hypothetical protein